MSNRPISDYGRPPGQWEEGMDIDRRQLLSATAGLALTEVLGPGDARQWHPLTRSLIERARRVGAAPRTADKLGIERVIRELVGASGQTDKPVIKWLPDPFAAHDFLSGNGLDELL
jgi:hypothetical protein